MKKEYIIGGLAIVGGLSLLAYLASKPRRNSEGFFNAGGVMSPPNQQNFSGSTCNLPDNFLRTVTTKENGIVKSYCARFDRIITMTTKGNQFVYRRQRNIPNAKFYNGNFINSNGSVIATNPTIIASSSYEYSFINGQLCM